LQYRQYRADPTSRNSKFDDPETAQEYKAIDKALKLHEDKLFNDRFDSKVPARQSRGLLASWAYDSWRLSKFIAHQLGRTGLLPYDRKVVGIDKAQKSVIDGEARKQGADFLKTILENPSLSRLKDMYEGEPSPARPLYAKALVELKPPEPAQPVSHVVHHNGQPGTGFGHNGWNPAQTPYGFAPGGSGYASSRDIRMSGGLDTDSTNGSDYGLPTRGQRFPQGVPDREAYSSASSSGRSSPVIRSPDVIDVTDWRVVPPAWTNNNNSNNPFQAHNPISRGDPGHSEFRSTRGRHDDSFGPPRAPERDLYGFQGYDPRVAPEQTPRERGGPLPRHAPAPVSAAAHARSPWSPNIHRPTPRTPAQPPQQQRGRSQSSSQGQTPGGPAPGR
jgi:hypothetical protein